MEWFTEVFLASLEAKMTNPKYPNECILSDKQAGICKKYMQHENHRSDYGWFSTYTFRTEKYIYTLSFRGKYNFLHKSKILTREEQYIRMIEEEISHDEEKESRKPGNTKRINRIIKNKQILALLKDGKTLDEIEEELF